MTAKTRKTTAHTRAQLTEALGWTPRQMARALAAQTVLPPFDMKTPRWSGPVVDDLIARRDDLAATIPDLLDTYAMLATLGLTFGEWKRGQESGAIPGPDVAEFWGRSLADDLTARISEIREQIPPQPLGDKRCAALLTETTGLAAAPDDIGVLATRGLTRIVDWYDVDRGWSVPLYDVAALGQISTDPAKLEILTEVIAEREAWIANSCTVQDALLLLPGWAADDLQRTARERDLKPGRFDRWSMHDIAALTADPAFIDQVSRSRLLWPREAAAHMRIRRTDFNYAVQAGLLAPADYTELEVRRNRRRETISVPLYEVGALDDLLTWPGVDWEAAQAAGHGDPSPLLGVVARARQIRALRDDLAAILATQVWVRFQLALGGWTITWAVRGDGGPDINDVTDILTGHLDELGHTGDIELLDPVAPTVEEAAEEA